MWVKDPLAQTALDSGQPVATEHSDKTRGGRGSAAAHPKTNDCRRIATQSAFIFNVALALGINGGSIDGPSSLPLCTAVKLIVIFLEKMIELPENSLRSHACAAATAASTAEGSREAPASLNSASPAE
jgi:hypothetical protein